MNTNSFHIDTHTSLYCIFGNPVRHSFSPLMHNSAFRKAGINAVYLAFEPSSLDEAISAMRSLPILGASVTIPFKIDILQYLDQVDPLAGQIGSVNTLKNSDGIITGYNTDGAGAVMALEENGIMVNGKSVMVIGNGGSARAIAFSLLENNCRITIAGRNRDKAIKLADDLNRKEHRADSCRIDEIDREIMHSIDIIINTTPVGMHPDSERIPIKADLISGNHAVFDIIYSPHKTLLLREGKKRGARIIHGIDMLINQGIKQFETWTGLEPPVEVMKEAANSAIKNGP